MKKPRGEMKILLVIFFFSSTEKLSLNAWSTIGVKLASLKKLLIILMESIHFFFFLIFISLNMKKKVP